MNDQDFLRAQTPFYAFDLSLLRGRMTRIRRSEAMPWLRLAMLSPTAIMGHTSMVT